MDQEILQHAENWAVSTFGAAELGDPRRTDHLVKIACALAENPSASLPHVSETWGETMGAYRFLDNPAISYEQILQPHWSTTYAQASERPRTLLLADTTECDFSTHKAMKGLAPIGNSREDVGFSVHTVLAMDPQTRAYPGMYHPGTLPSQACSHWGNEGRASKTGAGIAGLGMQCEETQTCATKPAVDLRRRQWQRYLHLLADL